MSDSELQKILIIDDSSDYRKLINTFISKLLPGVEFIEYDPLFEGIPDESFDWSSIDVLLLDYHLSIVGTTGLDILQKNHKKPEFPATIMLTAAGTEEVAISALNFGIYEYQPKQSLTKDKLKQSIIHAWEEKITERKKKQEITAHNRSFSKEVFYENLTNAASNPEAKRVLIVISPDNLSDFEQQIGVIGRDNLINHIGKNSLDVFKIGACNPNITRISDTAIAAQIDHPGSLQTLEFNMQGLCKHLQKCAFKFSDEKYSYTVSIGVLELSLFMLNAEQLIQIASHASDKADKNNSNSYYIWKESDGIPESDLLNDNDDKQIESDVPKINSEKELREIEETKKRLEEELKTAAEAKAKAEQESEKKTQQELKAVAEAKAKAEAELREIEETKKKLNEELKAAAEAKAEAESEKKTQQELKAVAEAKAKAEAELREIEETKKKLDEELKAAAEAKAKAEAESEKKTQQELKAVAEAKAKAEAELREIEETKKKLDEELKAAAEAKAKAEAEQEAKQRTQAELKAAAEAKAKAEAELKAKAEAELREIEETKKKLEEELKAVAEAKAKAEAESEKKTQEELKAVAEAKAKAEAELKAAEEAKINAQKEIEQKNKSEIAKTAIVEAETKAAKEKLEAELKAVAEAKAQAEAEIKATKEAKEKLETELKAVAEAKAQAEKNIEPTKNTSQEIASTDVDETQSTLGKEHENASATDAGDSYVVNKETEDLIEKLINEKMIIQTYQPVVAMSETEDETFTKVYNTGLQTINADDNINAVLTNPSVFSLPLQQIINEWVLRQIFLRITESGTENCHFRFLVTATEAWFSDASLFTWLQKILSQTKKYSPGKSIILQIPMNIFLMHKKRAEPLITTLVKSHGFTVALSNIDDIDSLIETCKATFSKLLILDFEQLEKLNATLSPNAPVQQTNENEQDDEDKSKTSLLNHIKSNKIYIITTGIENATLLTDSISLGTNYVIGDFVGEIQDSLIESSTVESFELT